MLEKISFLNSNFFRLAVASLLSSCLSTRANIPEGFSPIRSYIGVEAHLAQTNGSTIRIDSAPRNGNAEQIITAYEQQAGTYSFITRDRLCTHANVLCSPTGLLNDEICIQVPTEAPATITLKHRIERFDYTVFACPLPFNTLAYCSVHNGAHYVCLRGRFANPEE